jgi:tetratricopeptide (TPR) repeat protein
MLRDLAEAMEVITAERVLVLLLEDLHWSDYSTLEWLGFRARRRESAHLRPLSTYRPVEVIVREHPLKDLKQELRIHGQCRELPLGLLSESAVAEYLLARFAAPGTFSLSSVQRGKAHAQELLRELARTIYERTDGNPLFMVNLVNYLAEREILKTVTEAATRQSADATTGMPPSIVEMIERNLERLNRDEQAVLEAASVAAARFPTAAVAAALGRSSSEVEACCARLSRQQQFVQSGGTAEWPDGTVGDCFNFQHALYREVLYERLTSGRRTELHERIAAREEAAYGEQVAEVAAELAHHFGVAGNKAKALKYLDIAGARAVGRRSYREAEQHYRRAIAALHALPQSPERDQHELSLHVALSNVMATTRGFSAAETAEAYEKARSLAEHSGSVDTLYLFYGLSIGAFSRGEFNAAMAINNQMLKIARDAGSGDALVLTHTVFGTVSLFMGDLMAARKHFIQASDLYHGQDFRGLPNEPAIAFLVMRGVAEWHLGYPDGALSYMQQAAALARLLNNPFGLTFAHFGMSLLHRLFADWPRMLEACEQHFNVSTAFAFPVGIATAKIYGAYSRAKMGQIEGAADRIREGLTELVLAEFHECLWMLQACLAEAQVLSGDVDQAKATLEQALQAPSEALLWRPELLRLRGEFHLRSDPLSKGTFEMAEQDFRAAIDAARAMSAKSDELRATTSLARLLRDNDRRDEARTMLREVYGWFTEGFDTADLKHAKALLEELAA